MATKTKKTKMRLATFAYHVYAITTMEPGQSSTFGPAEGALIKVERKDEHTYYVNGECVGNVCGAIQEFTKAVMLVNPEVETVIPTIRYAECRDRIRNVDALPRGLNAPYLLCEAAIIEAAEAGSAAIDSSQRERFELEWCTPGAEGDRERWHTELWFDTLAEADAARDQMSAERTCSVRIIRSVREVISVKTVNVA
jgi:hypothetical protein